MALCEMCGREAPLFKTEIEGTILNVCDRCAKYGKVLKRIKTTAEKKKEQKQAKKQEEKPETEEFVVNNYSKLIREARNKLGKTQKEFASMLNEKESIIQKIETGTFEPPIPMAKRFEKILGIKLVETIEIEEEKPKQKGKTDSLTIGDLIKLKK